MRLLRKLGSLRHLMTSNTNRGHILCRGGDQGGCGEAEERGNARNQAFQVGAAHQERAVTMSANGVTVCYEKLKDCPICLLIKTFFLPCNHISIRKGVYQGGILLAEALLH